MNCKICGSSADPLFVGKVLRRYDVTYYRCGRCGFIQTEEPYWLEESYSSAIADVDIGPINRAMVGAQIVENLILGAFDPNAKYVDWGGGYGVFTRLMRDNGYDFYWKDLFCENLFAQQFVASESERYELLTAFEVFEHLKDPLAEIEEMLSYSDNLFFTTLLAPKDVNTDWWYLTPETGQHIDFYTPEALRVIADRFGLNIASDGRLYHLLSRKSVSRGLIDRAVRNGRIDRLKRAFLRRRHRKTSLLEQDFRTVSGWKV